MAVLFDHEKLEVYQLELKVIAWVAKLLPEVKAKVGSLITEESDHINRASLSSLFNTAEGNGKRQRQVRVRYFDDARGSATECAACLDSMVAKEACTGERVVEGKEMLQRIVSMLTRLAQRFEGPEAVGEEEIPYGRSEEGEKKREENTKIEDEDEHEDD